MGKYDSSKNVCKGGNLGTWAINIGKDFILKNELVSAIVGRVTSDSFLERAYGFRFFFNLLTELRPTPPILLVNSFKTRLRDNHDQDIYNALSWVLDDTLSNDYPEWVRAFKLAVEQYTPPSISDDDIPF